tara:strand:- start:2521 stop:3540 length:1020 start_codon:yes stop_codon:yes gene_type:complete
MKILLITDQHFGVRNDNQVFIDKYRKFYKKILIPFIDKYKITNVICLGDTFDKRKSINYNSLEAAKEMWFDPLRERDIHMDMLVGNHDIYYKNTLRINSPSLLLSEYENISVIDHPCELSYDGVPICLVPWICDENREETRRVIESSVADICLGHLELNGFESVPGYFMEHGDDPGIFNKFDLVCTGHYHMKSNKGNVHYLGNPYQLYWGDYGQKRGFHVINTDSKKLSFFHNPYDTFVKIYYNDTKPIPLPSLDGSFVKVIVEKKSDQGIFDTIIQQLQNLGAADLKIIEDLTVDLDDVDDAIETEDTLTTLERCVADLDNKDDIFAILKSLYLEAQR